MSKIIVNEKEYSVDDIEDMIETIQVNEEDYEELQNKYDELNADFDFKVDKIKQQEDRNTDLIKTIKEMQRKLDKSKLLKEKGLVDQADHYKKCFDEAEKKISCLEHELKDCKKSDNPINDIYVDQIIKQEAKIKKQNEQIKLLQQENQKVKEDKIYINDDRDNIISTLKEELGQVKAELKSEITNSKRFANNINKKENTDITILKDKIKKLEEDFDNLDAEKIELESNYLNQIDKLKSENTITEKIMENAETQTEERNTLPEKEITTPKLQSTEFTKEDIFKIFDMIYQKKMSKKENPKVATRLMNKRKEVVDYIINGKVMKDDKTDYSVDFMKTIITLTKDNNKKEERINKLLDKL